MVEKHLAQEIYTDKRGKERIRFVRTGQCYMDFWRSWHNAPHYRNLRREGLPVDGVLLSHAHLDHAGDLTYLREDIPIYATSITAFIAKAMQDSGHYRTGEVAYINPRVVKEGEKGLLGAAGDYQQRPFGFLDGEVKGEGQAFWDASPAKTKGMETAPCQPVRFDGSGAFRIGNLWVRWWPVDHSIPGSAAFAVETSIGWVAFTGDIRFHGRDGALTWKLAEDLAELEHLVLLCEGTRVESTHRITETEVCENALAIVRKAGGQLVVADFGPRNVERLLTFRDIAERTKRLLVILPKDAYLLYAMRLVDNSIPDVNDAKNLILIYDAPKAERKRWEGEVRSKFSTRFIGFQEVAASPGGFILCFSFWDVNDLLDLIYLGVQGGIYLYSSSPIYDDEQRIDIERLGNWVERLGMQFVGDPRREIPNPYHASGHASAPELLHLIRHVKPKVVIPIHTERPEQFVAFLRGEGIEVRQPKVGEPIAL
jgi:ribonuclease J